MKNCELFENDNNIESNQDFVHPSRKDYSVVKYTARIAVYDNLKSPPRIINIQPGTTNEYIEKLTTEIYNESVRKGGKIPYTVIREISENFIHANFTEIVVSILDQGNTIRFTDQGPGFKDIKNAQLPGFTSATESMKQYIRGVGSGLPTVKDYLSYSDGYIKIENNLSNGAVVTISVLDDLNKSNALSNIEKEKLGTKQNRYSVLSPNLNSKELTILKLIYTEGALGVSEISNYISSPLSSVHKLLSNLEQYSLINKLPNKKRTLSNEGFRFIKSIK